jgi:hypothetical protein
MYLCEVITESEVVLEPSHKVSVCAPISHHLASGCINVCSWQDYVKACDTARHETGDRRYAKTETGERRTTTIIIIGSSKHPSHSIVT